MEPEIDATDYSKTSHGLEDQFTVLDWHPTLTDGAEKVTALSLPGWRIAGSWLRVGGVESQLTVVAGQVTLTAAQPDSLLNGDKLLVKAPEDNDRDTTIPEPCHSLPSTMWIRVSGREKVIDGNLHVDIQAVVEPDGVTQTGGAPWRGGADIDLAGRFLFTDPSILQRGGSTIW